MSARQRESLKRKTTNNVCVTGNLEKKIICFTILVSVVIILVISVFFNSGLLSNCFTNSMHNLRNKNSNLLNYKSDICSNIQTNKHKSLAYKIISKLRINKKRKLAINSDTVTNGILDDLTLYKKFCYPMQVINTKYINLSKKKVDTLL